MKVFKINDTIYTIAKVTAIAVADNMDESARQDALLVVADNGTETVEHVVFGWEFPEAYEDLIDMFDDSCAWEAMCEEHSIKEEVA